ncbi:bifunctional DNA primase/polymerase [Kribbella sp. NPDC023855]|uniref:bifunctional DNA primase/polymerase n=1 Tax=Kribbella sp. NPDC023855 TaxID=3154698 RepID=UPI0033EC4B83
MSAPARRRRRPRPVTDPVHQLLCRAAHWHADQGLFVFPLAPGRKVPAVDKDWESAATTDHLRIARTWQQAPYNIGVATGPSGLLVVDLDLPKTPDDLPPAEWGSRGAATGAEVLALVAADHTVGVPGTYTVITPSGGQHLYFQQPAGRELGNSAGRIGWKIDTRGHGGYVVGAGSLIGQRHYTATGQPPAPFLPDWITQTLTTPEAIDTARPAPGPVPRHTDAYALAALTGELDKLLAATEGSRNDALNAAAFVLGTLIGADMLDEATTRDELISAAGRIGLPRTEAERTILSGLTAGKRNPRARH